jgi:hypothetical protein
MNHIGVEELDSTGDDLLDTLLDRATGQLVRSCSMAARRACVTIAAIAVMAALAGCSSRKRDQPDPAACVTAADCAPGPLVNPDDVCCDTGVHLDVFSRAYLDWRARIRASECKNASCPVLPPPTPPRECALEPRCVDHRCTGSCAP